MLILEQIVCEDRSQFPYLFQIANIGSERSSQASESISKFPCLTDVSASVPADADISLALSIRRRELSITEQLLDAIVRHSLTKSGVAALKSFEISEAQCLRLISSLDELIDPFIRQGSYSADKLRSAIKQECSDEALARVFTKCAEFLESSSASWSADVEGLMKYLSFVSLAVDAKFVNWYVRSGAIAVPLAKLAAIVSRCRNALFKEQQAWIKMESGKNLEATLVQRTAPRKDGKLFYYELK